jgi:ABC-type transport system involved in multi-copper enzyme maturation permease subunit
LSSTLDVGERLNITGSYKGPDMFRGRQVMYGDFWGLHQLFGVLIILVYGFLSFRCRQYLEFLGSMVGFKKVYFHILAARFLLLCLYFILVTAVGIALVFCLGIHFTGPDFLVILGYLGIWLLTALVVFGIGAAIGAIKSLPTAGVILTITWVFLFYISDFLVIKGANVSANKIKSIYQQENEKWDALMRFENRAANEAGKYRPENANTQTGHQLIDSFMNREYKEMMALEKDMENEMRNSKKAYEWWSLLSPGTILSAVACEMSSQGVNNLADFDAYSQDLKDRFCQFYKYKKFYAPEEKGVESFVKNEENIYYGRTGLPSNITWALLELLALSFIFHGVSYYCHKKSFSKVEGEMAGQWDPGKWEALNTVPGEGKAQVWKIEEEGFIRRINNHFSGSKDYLYLCQADSLPGDMEAQDFLELSAVLMGVNPDDTVLSAYQKKEIGALKKMEKFNLLMKVTELAERAGKRHYLFHDLAHDMPVEASVAVKKRMEELRSRGLWVVLLVWEHVVMSRQDEKQFGISESPRWFNMVEYWAGIKDD